MSINERSEKNLSLDAIAGTAGLESPSEDEIKINASGHRDQLQRGYGIISICGLALAVDNAWVAIGTSLAISICEWHFTLRCWRTRPV